MDVLGVRLKGSKEKVDGETLVLDEQFINELNGYKEDVKLWAEVGTGSISNLFPMSKEDYCKRIFGVTNHLKKVYLDFDKKGKDLSFNDDVLIVPHSRCKDSILRRFAS